uniref:Ubiquitin carboxyl-terminal hydrolase n=1 Tax=Talaromyces marneffei PM1 TaxID=1077442 RepID=A0A093VDX4_TALMA
MPDKPGTVAAYAAGASLAAITLFYVFGPNFTIDGDESSNSDRKKGVVGLSNPANDCFINSVLQALAGLGQLRVYLIRELHRRELDGPDVYNQLPGPDEVTGKRSLPPDRLRELQQGTVTLALKEMLDRLNERPIYKKTISARSFIQALEFAFRTRISRNQQDAQEFLQIVAERLCEEYHAAVQARQRAQRAVVLDTDASSIAQDESDGNSVEVSVRIDDGSKDGLPAIIDNKLKEIDNEHGFPLEGQLESQIECQTCHYQYRPNRTSCGLQHALETKIIAKTKAKSDAEIENLDAQIRQIQQALDTDPEQGLEGVDLPAADLAPKRRIARHMRITAFPKVVAIHLSRSIFDQTSSTKNAAKVSFPERLPLGGILNRKWYKLLGIVCHKGSHNSGHYESFRRSHLYPPFSTPDAFRSYAASRTGSENPSVAGSPRLPATKKSNYSPSGGVEPSPLSISPVESSLSLSSAIPNNPPFTAQTPSSISSSSSQETANPPRSSLQLQPSSSEQIQDLPRRSSSVRLGTPKHSTSSSAGGGLSAQRLLRSSRRKTADRWWRISDDKVKECKTNDVLGMQKEVYLLFYEMESPS